MKKKQNKGPEKSKAEKARELKKQREKDRCDRSIKLRRAVFNFIHGRKKEKFNVAGFCAKNGISRPSFYKAVDDMLAGTSKSEIEIHKTGQKQVLTDDEEWDIIECIKRRDAIGNCFMSIESRRHVACYAYFNIHLRKSGRYLPREWIQTGYCSQKYLDYLNKKYPGEIKIRNSKKLAHHRQYFSTAVRKLHHPVDFGANNYFS